jgi:hypothetical protein
MESASPNTPTPSALPDDASPFKTDGAVLGREELAVIANVIKNLTEYRTPE